MQIRFTKNKEPVLIIPESIYNTMLANVRSTQLEITFILEIIRSDKDKTKFITKGFYLPPQWNEPAESKTIDSQYPKWCVDLVKKGIKLNGQGHTHPNMPVSPSGYDVNFFKELEKETNSFQFRLIMNQKGLIHCDLIDKEEGYVAEQMNVIVPCEGFNLIINNTSHNIEITNLKEISIINLSNKLTVTLASALLTVSSSSIEGAEIKKEELIKTQRRFQTDEAIKHTTNTIYKYTGSEDLPYSTKAQKKEKSKGTEEEDNYMSQYYAERGYYGY